MSTSNKPNQPRNPNQTRGARAKALRLQYEQAEQPGRPELPVHLARLPDTTGQSSFSLRKLLIRLDRGFQPVAKRFDVVLDVACPAGDLLVRGREADFRVVFHHLIHNAIQYNQQKGRVAVLIRREKADKLSVAILDNGPGLPLPSSWTLLSSGFDHTTAIVRSITKPSGGLTVVCSTLKRCGSRLHLKSKQGLGTKASFLLSATA